MNQFIPRWIITGWWTLFASRYIGMFFVFKKIPDYPSWYGIIPLWNEYNLCRYSSKPTWRVLRFILPDILLFVLKIEINTIVAQFSRRTLLRIGLLSAGFLFLPFFIFQLIIHMDIAKKFQKDSGFAILMTVFPWFFYGYLAYSGSLNISSTQK